VIASLNCTTLGGWVDYARGLEQAGADGIELNVYFIPADLSLSARDWAMDSWGIEHREPSDE